jgi:hypothetical protein
MAYVPAAPTPFSRDRKVAPTRVFPLHWQATAMEEPMPRTSRAVRARKGQPKAEGREKAKRRTNELNRGIGKCSEGGGIAYDEQADWRKGGKVSC